MDKDKKIIAEGISWKPDSDRAPVLEGISAQLEPGHIYGIIGPNGAGKSSLLKHMLRFIPLQAGSIQIDGRTLKEYAAASLSRELSFVPQKTDVDTDFTAREVVMTGRNPYQKRFQGESEEDRQIVEQAIKDTGSMDTAEQPFSQLSGGEAQKIIVARAVAQKTPWMLLDEPTASLDIRNQIEILDALRRMNRERGISVLMVLHDINMAARYCDRLVMLKKGRIIHAGQTEELMKKELLQELYDIEFEEVKDSQGRKLFFPISG